MSKPPHRNISADSVILAMDTSGLTGSIALVQKDRCLAEYTLFSHKTHSRRLLVDIDRLMTEAETGWEHIAAIVTSIGPGSFTGLRIGLSTAKGLIMATGKPLVGISTLDGLAHQLTHAGLQICPILDARKKEVYCGLYRPEENGSVKPTGEPMVLTPKRLAEMIDEPTIFTGDGVTIYRELLSQTLREKAVFTDGTVFFPRASTLGCLAWQAFEKKKFLDPVSAAPMYIRSSEAEKTKASQKKCR